MTRLPSRLRALLFAAIAAVLLLDFAALPKVGIPREAGLSTLRGAHSSETEGLVGYGSDGDATLTTAADTDESDPDREARDEGDTTTTTPAADDHDVLSPTTTTTPHVRNRRTDFSGPPVDSVTAQLNATHSGAHDDPDLPDTLRLLWSRTLNASTGYPLIVGDRVFVVAQQYTATYDPPIRLWAFDRLTGEDAWPSIEVGGSQYTVQLSYDAGRLFVLNYDGLLRAIDPGTGEVLWATADLGPNASSAPTAKHGRVVVVAGGAVTALRESDGAVLWSRNVAPSGRSAPIVTDDAVYVVRGNLHAYKFDAATGETVWHTAQDGHTVGSRNPVLYRGRLYARVGDDQFLSTRTVVLDAATGDVVDEIESRLQPAFQDGIGIFVDGDLNARAVDVDTGEVLWSFAADTSAAPIIVNDSVFLLSNQFQLTRLDLYTGEQKWIADEGGVNGYANENAESFMQGGLASGRGVVAVPTGGVAVYG